MYDEFFRKRLTQLRMALPDKMSERKLSELLGHSDSYIRGITSGRALPAMQEFFYLCDFLGVTPNQFFDEGTAYPAKIQSIVNDLNTLSEEQLDLIASLLKNFKKQ